MCSIRSRLWSEYHYFDEADGMPIITLGTTEPEAIIVETGTLPDDFYSTLQSSDVEMQEPVDFDTKASLIENYVSVPEYGTDKSSGTSNTKIIKTHISDSNNTRKKDEKKNAQPSEESKTETLKVRDDLQEFSARSDGSVNCKLCGKIFASRQHWYRHKYRAHVVSLPPEPVPLNKCEKCLIFFKSRKGYLGHMSSKHSETLLDVTPVLINEQVTALAKSQDIRVVKPATNQSKPKDLETAIPMTIVQNYQGLSVPATPATPVPSRNTSRTRSVDKKRSTSAAKAPEEIDPRVHQERRAKDETFVMGIIEKVRRQCETEPEAANRRGYSRKPVRT